MSATVTALSPLDCIRPNTFAAAAAPANWDAAVRNVETNGAYSQPGGLPATLGLADIQGPRDGSHQADYLNVWGGRSQDGTWHTGEVTLVSENWQAQGDGNVRIDQWLHQLSADGTQRRSTHGWLLEGPGGRVLGTGYFRPTDEEQQANVDALLAKFATFQPSPGQSLRDQGSDGRVESALRRITACSASGPELPAPAPSAGFSLRR